jgi:FkbM family methyltransferase
MDIQDENKEQVDINNCEIDEQNLARQYINPNDSVLELGARYGSVSCVINSKLIHKTNHLAVEPDSRIWDALERNKRVNGCEFQIVKGFISNKKHTLTNLESGYATFSVETSESDISSYLLTQFPIQFNVLVADCEGFLEQFFDENPNLVDSLRMVMFEADAPHRCNYQKIENMLVMKNFYPVHRGFQNVWLKR